MPRPIRRPNGAALAARPAHGPPGQRDEVAAAIAYLASPLAGATTGTALAVNGGMSGLRPGRRGRDPYRAKDRIRARYAWTAGLRPHWATSGPGGGALPPCSSTPWWCRASPWPRTALERGAAQRLFEHVRQLQAQGVALLYISHHLEEVFEICTDVAVLRDGAMVLTARWPR